jgi:acetylornithine deacetylase/succinyl-diaminopimelate desuccinylase-like protein
VAALHRPDGRVAASGFYEDVRPVGDAERARLARHVRDDASLLAQAGAPRGWGDERFTLHERTTIRPALVVTELGAAGAGHATLPVSASANVNVRLVPDQDPLAVERVLRRHVAASAPAASGVELRRRSASPPFLVDARHPAMVAAARACRRGFGAAPALVRSGGSIPAAGLLQRALGVPVVLMGFALAQDNAHGANESFSLAGLRDGIATSIHFLAEMERMPWRR